MSNEPLKIYKLNVPGITYVPVPPEAKSFRIKDRKIYFYRDNTGREINTHKIKVYAEENKYNVNYGIEWLEEDNEVTG